MTAQDELTAENRLLFWVVTLLGFFNAFIPVIVKLFLHLLNCDSQYETSLRRQACDLKAELGTISMVNEFAKYAKIERKLNKVNDELKNQNNIQMVYQIKLRLAVYIILYAISSIAMAYLIWNYRYQVLVRVPDNLFYPIGLILSFPTGISGVVTITPWAMINVFVGRKIIKSIF